MEIFQIIKHNTNDITFKSPGFVVRIDQSEDLPAFHTQHLLLLTYLHNQKY